jgi:microcystin-dependent protein
MPSTFSTSLRIELIGPGEQAGVWGTTTNNNLGELIEQAITGITTLDVTSGNITLTSLNGVVDEARSAVLSVIGTPGVTRILTIPNENKNYTVQNSTANIVQVKTASGTAFDCPPLSHSYITCNESNVVVGRSITTGANAVTSLAAPFNSPAFTGVPTAPTAAGGTNTTQLATTAFVNAEIASDTAGLAPLASPTFTGVPAAPTASVGTNTTQLATTAFVNAEIASDTAGLAPLASPTFTGVPAAPTASVGTNTTQVATTAFVNAEIASDTAGLAPLASPAFTGTPTAPTAAGGTNTTQLATTAFTNAAIASALPGALPVGLITLWSGSIVSIPTGWTLCDGTAGTPDLRDRFVVGAGTTYAVNATGGVNTVTLTTAQMPSHSHTNSVSTTDLAHIHSNTVSTADLSHTHNVVGNSDVQSVVHTHTGTTDSAGAHNHNLQYRNGGTGSSTDAVPGSSGDLGTLSPNAISGVGNHVHGFTTSGISSTSHQHAISFTSAAMSANSTHTHTVTVGAMSANQTHSHTVTINSAGSGTAHENRPPYFALAYIMKI